MYSTLGRILEEGIACLVQHGTNFKIDDPIGTLTNRDMFLSKEHFKILNESMISIKNGDPDYGKIYRINVYVLGYIISKTIYENGDKSILDEWTVNFNYIKPIRRYIEICKKNKRHSGFYREIEDWLLN